MLYQIYTLSIESDLHDGLGDFFPGVQVGRKYLQMFILESDGEIWIKAAPGVPYSLYNGGCTCHCLAFK